MCLESPSLRERTGAGVSVAIVDSGVNPDHPHVGQVAGGAQIEMSGVASGDYVDRLGHGTAVFAAVQEKAPDAEILAARVFAAGLKTSIRALVAAIDWAADRGTQLVNMSLGTLREEHGDVLAAAVSRLGAGGGLVVAAAEADGRPWWPGSLPTVVGVVADPEIARQCVEVRGGEGQARTLVAASPYPRSIPGVPPERNLHGTSFAVANATGMLARALEGQEQPLDAEAALANLGL